MFPDIDITADQPTTVYAIYIDGKHYEVRGTYQNRYGEPVYRVYRDGVPMANTASCAHGVQWIDRNTRKPPQHKQLAQLRKSAREHAKLVVKPGAAHARNNALLDMLQA